MSRAALVLRYAAFAVVAVLANLGMQRAVLWLFGQGGWAFVLALVVGTGAGLVVKFVLDALWIFDAAPRDLRSGGRTFGLYTLTGGLTTCLFWGTETAFWLAFGTPFAREGGAVLGLALGYVLKYRLDRQFVFGKPRERAV